MNIQSNSMPLLVINQAQPEVEAFISVSLYKQQLAYSKISGTSSRNGGDNIYIMRYKDFVTNAIAVDSWEESQGFED